MICHQSPPPLHSGPMGKSWRARGLVMSLLGLEILLRIEARPVGYSWMRDLLNFLCGKKGLDKSSFDGGVLGRERG